nr:putative ribonuclease H-like domain-containing protein [Tanacetum cinerariifolium]
MVRTDKGTEFLNQTLHAYFATEGIQHTAMHPSSRAVVLVNTDRPINTAYPRSTMNGAKPSSNVFNKTHSTVRRTFNQRTTPKTNDLKEKVNTVKVNNVTTVGTKAVVSAVQGNGENDQGIFNGGCSRHMIGNKSFLTDYQEIHRRFVVFGGSPKGGKIYGKDHLDKFKGKADEGFLVGYSVNSKAGQEKVSDHEYILLPFIPSNSPLDIDEVPDKGDEGVSKGSGIDDQEKTNSSTQDVNTIGPSINTANININTSSLNINNVGHNDPSMLSLEETGIFDDVYDDKELGAEADTNNLELLTVVSSIPTTRVHKDHLKEQIIGDLNLATQTRRMINFSKENAMISYINKQRRTNHKDYQNCLFSYFLSQQEPKKVIQALANPSWIEAMQEELLQFKLQKVWTLVDLLNGKRAIGTKWVFRNKKDERGIVVRNKARLVAQGYTQEEGIDYDEVFAHVPMIEAIRLFLAYALFIGFIVYQMDVKSAFLYGTIEEEVYVCQPPSCKDPHFPNKVYKVEKALYGLHQAPRAWYETLSTYLLENRFRRGTIDKTLFVKKDRGNILLVQVYVNDIIFGSTKKSLCDEFEQMMHKRFQMSYMGELTFSLRLQVKQKNNEIFISQDKYVADILKKFDFTTVKIASTPREPNKALIKDAEAKDVDAHLYRSMIGSLMYLTASRPDIMISTTRSCQFLGKRLISWQCKKQSIVANSTTKAEYVPAANCCGQAYTYYCQMKVNAAKHKLITTGMVTVAEDVRLQALVDGKKVIVNEASIRCYLKLQDAEGTACLPNDAIFEELARMGAKTTAWNEFSSTIASAIICLANNQKFNFFKYILDKMVKNLEAGVKLFMFPRFVQVFVNHQVSDMSHYEGIFVNPSFTKKVLDLEKSHNAQGNEIVDLKKRVKKLERKKKVKDLRFEKIIQDCLSARIVSPDEEGLDQGRINEEDLFGVHDLDGDEVIVDVTAGENIEQDATIAKKETLIEIKAAKPRPRGVIVQEPSEFRTTSSLQPSQLPMAKDKGKGIMVEPKKPLKKKEQIMMDEEVARKLEAKMKAEMEEEERIARDKDEANKVVIEE